MKSFVSTLILIVFVALAQCQNTSKPIASFIDRFNKGTELTKLFNPSDAKLDVNNKKYSKDYASLKDKFINDVVTNKKTLSKTLDSVYAETFCNVVYRGKQFNMRLILMKNTTNATPDWQLMAVDASELKLSKPQSFPFNFSIKADEAKLTIPANSNENSFNILQTLFHERKSIQYLGKNIDSTQIKTFIYYIYNGQLKFQNVESIVYHFSINGWIVSVKDFTATDGSDWLIDNIVPVGISTKNKFITDNLGVVFVK